MQLQEKKPMIWISVLSVIVPTVVAILLFMPYKMKLDVSWIYFLPHLIGMLNTTTSLSLVAGFIAVKRKKIAYHRLFMTISFVLGTIFLVTYIIYHATVPSTKFGGEGMVKNIYYFFLLSHILLSVVVVPFVLLAFYYALTNKIDKHKKVVKFTLPIWLYVSVTGVIIYLMISPYYQF